MAILVHHSFPDEFEMANGVVVSDFRSTPAALSICGAQCRPRSARPVLPTLIRLPCRRGLAPRAT